MKIGIDLTPLQNAHRMRGIGAVLLHTINHLPPKEDVDHTYVFFVTPTSIEEDPLKLLSIDHIEYEVRTIAPQRAINRRLPGKLNLFVSALNQLIKIRQLATGDLRLQLSDLQDIDAYLQIDPDMPLPKSTGKLKKVLFLHDIIPYVLEWDYLWNYQTSRLRGFSKKAALRVHARRILYAYKYKLNLKRADILLANSQSTKDDISNNFMISPNRIKVAHLGLTEPDRQQNKSTLPTSAYAKTSWGYLPKQQRFDLETPFILFVGGADRRRKLQDLVAAFNMLRAQGIQIKLVLAGDSMQGPMNVGTEENQHALRTSSYLNDIVFLGFTDGSTQQWLYEHATAFVFPSKYEGFGLPVLEAMRYGTPVITYNNAAVQEVAGDLPFYVTDSLGIRDAVLDLLQHPQADDVRRRRQKHAASYSWTDTAKAILKHIDKR